VDPAGRSHVKPRQPRPIGFTGISAPAASVASTVPATCRCSAAGAKLRPSLSPTT